MSHLQRDILMVCVRNIPGPVKGFLTFFCHGCSLLDAASSPREGPIGRGAEPIREALIRRLMIFLEQEKVL